MIDQIPASIVQAICAVQASLGAVSKSNRNQHGGYQFASTDDIYAALTRKMGEVGLTIISLEDLCEVKRVEKDGKISQWAQLEFSFVLATAEATWTDKRARRTLYIQITGPQTFQAAQSYAEKAFLRSLFKIPTGDMDLDSMPQGDTEEDQIVLSQQRRPKSSSRAKKDGDDRVFNEIRNSIRTAQSRDLLMQIRTLYNDEWTSMPSRWHELLEHEYEDRLSDFGNGAL